MPSFEWPSDPPGGVGTGTVTSVGTGFGLTGGTITTTGTISLAAANVNGFLNNTGGVLSFQPAAGTGTVTSVGMTVPSVFSVAGSPITTSGTLAVTYTDPGVDALVGWDNTDNALVNMLIGAGLSYDAATNTLSTTGSAPIYPINELVYGDGVTPGGITDSGFTRNPAAFNQTLITSANGADTATLTVDSVGSGLIQSTATNNNGFTTAALYAGMSGATSSEASYIQTYADHLIAQYSDPLEAVVVSKLEQSATTSRFSFIDVANSISNRIELNGSSGLSITNNNGTTDFTTKWPVTDGTIGQAMVTDAAGQLSFASFAPITSGNIDFRIPFWNTGALDAVAEMQFNPVNGAIELTGIPSARNIFIGPGITTTIGAGNRNIVIGTDAAPILTGDDNTIIGDSSAAALTSGHYNTLVGINTNVSSGTISNSIVIGRGSVAGSDDTFIVAPTQALQDVKFETSGFFRIAPQGTADKVVFDLFNETYTLGSNGAGDSYLTLHNVNHTFNVVVEDTGVFSSLFTANSTGNYSSFSDITNSRSSYSNLDSTSASVGWSDGTLLGGLSITGGSSGVSFQDTGANITSRWAGSATAAISGFVNQTSNIDTGFMAEDGVATMGNINASGNEIKIVTIDALSTINLRGTYNAVAATSLLSADFNLGTITLGDLEAAQNTTTIVLDDPAQTYTFNKLATGGADQLVKADTNGVLGLFAGTPAQAVSMYTDVYGATADYSAGGFGNYVNLSFTTGTGATSVLLPTTGNFLVGDTFTVNDLDFICATSNITVDAGTGATITTTAGISQTDVLALNGTSVTYRAITSTQWMQEI